MHLIYQLAHVTIIAAAGSGSHYGLPGVSTTPRRPQPCARVGKYLLVSTLPDPRRDIKASTWMQRAWTYQESFFSQRRLLFTERQVYFDCRSGAACESIAHFKRHAGAEHHLFQSHDPFHDQPGALTEHLANYCGRRLSYEADAIRAIEGVLNVFRTKEIPVHHFWGVLITQAEVARAKRRRAAKFVASQRGRSESFAAGLCWRPAGPGVRRSHFPSWSWAGWSVPLTDRVPEIENGLRLRESDALPSVFVETLEGSLFSFDQEDVFWRAVRSPETLSKVIHLDAWTIPLYIQAVAKKEVWVTASRGSRWRRDSSDYSALFTGSGRSVWVAVYLHQKAFANPQTLAHSNHLTPRGVVGIVLGNGDGRARDLPAPECTFVLVAQNLGSYYERIGHMEIMIPRVASTLRGPQSLEDFSTASWRAWDFYFASKQIRRIRLGEVIKWPSLSPKPPTQGCAKRQGHMNLAGQE